MSGKSPCFGLNLRGSVRDIQAESESSRRLFRRPMARILNKFAPSQTNNLVEFKTDIEYKLWANIFGKNDKKICWGIFNASWPLAFTNLHHSSHNIEIMEKCQMALYKLSLVHHGATQVGGAQHRSIVHNGAQHSSVPLKWYTNRHMDAAVFCTRGHIQALPDHGYYWYKGIL